MKPFLTSVLTALRQLGKGRSSGKTEEAAGPAGEGENNTQRARQPGNFSTLPLPDGDQAPPPTPPPGSP